MNPHPLKRPPRRPATAARATLALAAALSLFRADARADDDDGLPVPVGLDRFGHLLEAPPFRRLLSLSDRLVLSGVAQLPGNEMVTVLNPETRETFVVTRSPNPRGWRLVDLVTDTDLLKVSATISAGGREVTLRFDPRRLRPRGSRNRTEPGREDEIQVVVEALLRRLDPEAATTFEALGPRDQEDFRRKFATYLQTYPESSDPQKASFVRDTLDAIAPPADNAGDRNPESPAPSPPDPPAPEPDGR